MTESDTSGPSESDIPGWLTIGRAGSCNGHAVLRAVEAFGSVRGLLEAGDRELAALGFSRAATARLRGVDRDAVHRERDALERIGVSLVPIGTRRYPALLAAISSPPPVLYCRGDPGVLECPQIAIVGARAATRGGRERARLLAHELAACGLVVTSGLARGIDAAAHRGALDAGGRSVAVVATGPERIYPRSNAGLARELVEAGTVVTERAPGTPPRPENFPRRNRLISGLSLGVLVVEASLRSGSLITARLAADEGREVFAVPGSVDNALSRGCHSLIRDGAKLVESVTDVLDEIRHFGGAPIPPVVSGAVSGAVPGVVPGAVPQAVPGAVPGVVPGVVPGAVPQTVPGPVPQPEAGPVPQPEAGDGPGGGAEVPGASERNLLDAVGSDPVTLDELVDYTAMPANRLAAALLALEIDGWIEVLPGNRYVRTAGRKGRPA